MRTLQICFLLLVVVPSPVNGPCCNRGGRQQPKQCPTANALFYADVQIWRMARLAMPKPTHLRLRTGMKKTKEIQRPVQNASSDGFSVFVVSCWPWCDAAAEPDRSYLVIPSRGTELFNVAFHRGKSPGWETSCLYTPPGAVQSQWMSHCRREKQ